MFNRLKLRFSVNGTKLLMCLGLVIVIADIYVFMWLPKFAEERATLAVRTMYTYTNLDSLNANQDVLAKLVSDNVFNQLTVDNIDKSLTTYIKMKSDPCNVDVIKTTDSYVLYHLSNVNVDPTRVFVFFYDYNLMGKITYVRECESYDFYSSFAN